MDKSEQWLLNGDCRICRRKKYCSKPCTRCKREIQAEIKQVVANCLNEATCGVMSEAIYKTVDILCDWR